MTLSCGLIIAALLRRSCYHTQLTGKRPSDREGNAPKVTQPVKWQDWAVCILWRDDGLMAMSIRGWTRPQGHRFKCSLYRAGSRDLERPPDPSEVTGLGLCPCFPELRCGHSSLFPDASRLSTQSLGKPPPSSQSILRPELSGSSCLEKLH